MIQDIKNWMDKHGTFITLMIALIILLISFSQYFPDVIHEYHEYHDSINAVKDTINIEILKNDSILLL